MNKNEFMLPPAGPEAEEPPLRLFEDILHNRMTQKKEEITELTEMVQLVQTTHTGSICPRVNSI